MDKYLIEIFDLEANVNDITPIDKFKLYRDFDRFINALKEYASKNELTNIEQFYFDFETDPRREFFHRLEQTYFDNYFLSIYFILSNPVLITKPTFANLYRDKHYLPIITDYIINLYQTLDSNTSRFYNKILLEKFISNLDFTPLSDDVTSSEYKTYFQLFAQETSRLKSYLTELVKDPKWSTHPAQGLSEFDPKYYQFAFQYHTGLRLKSSDNFMKIKQWAQKHLDYLMNEVNRTCDRLLTNDSDKTKSLPEKMRLVGEHPSQRWSSKQEIIDTYQLCLSKYRRIFIAQNQFKEFNPPHITILDNPLLAGGYYYKDNFYLNVSGWSEGNYRYEVENLTLHETIPGHHMQLDISYHSPNHNYLTAIAEAPCNGFVEGWGLFAEHLGDSMFDDPWVYFGYLQMNILRTFRIIAEVLLHVEGQAPDEVIQLAKQYLTASEASITAEIYRYRILPGQACSYKIGLEIFKRAIRDKFQVTEVKDFLRSDLLAWYKDVLWQTERPLDVFLLENQITWTFD
ncbi:unnamed protein product [Adineta ricciae]|uniref:DUF885 domain-containing protein n=1 Tax=Adineta ricciae TaxID=249248 RepID=A0A815GMC1_ADIRI|nr:unnamed protein product [Adineta ricciae]CAF1556724.1 unnamed protein product [Adineta ricciae]